jgi:L-asparaginase
MAIRIAVIGAGGTIAMVGRHAYDWVEYGDSGIVRDVHEVVREMGELLPGIEWEPISFRMLGSTGITPADWLELSQKIAGLSGYDGVVVTHGTATLEETAYFLDLSLDLPLPVVLVGAQRPPNTASSDALANFRTALAAAASTETRGLGVLVAMNNYLFAARDVAKLSNHQLEAFGALEYGPLGRVEPDGTVILRRLPVRKDDRPHFNLAGLSTLPRVDIALSYGGADRVAIDAFVAAGAKAIVSAGLPPGRAANAERVALVEAAAKGIVVVQCSRAPMGGVPVQRYNVVDGILAGMDLQPQKARILAMLALTRTTDRNEIQNIFLRV